MAGTRRFSKPVDGPMTRAEKSALIAALDAYEATRLTPGPARAAAMATIKPLLLPFGVFRHAGRVYHWSLEDDSLVRHLSRQTWGKPKPFARDCIVSMWRGVDVDDSSEPHKRRLWHAHKSGRAV